MASSSQLMLTVSKGPLCDQDDGTNSHLLTGCAFAHQVWYSVLSYFSLQHLCPQPGDNFLTWFEVAVERAGGQRSNGAHSIIILTMWRLWRLHNALYLMMPH